MIELTLDDAMALRDEALERVEKAADEFWKRQAALIVADYADLGMQFTTDDVMNTLGRQGVTTPEPRALGPIMRHALKAGLVRRVGYTPSKRRHCSPIPIYVGVRP